MRIASPKVTKQIRQQHADKLRELRKIGIPKEKLKIRLKALRRLRESVGASTNGSKRSPNQ